MFWACVLQLGLTLVVTCSSSGAKRQLQTNASHLMPVLSHLWSFSDTDQSWQIMPSLAAKMSHCMSSFFWQRLNINLIICQTTKLFGVTAHLGAQKSHNSLLLCKQATSHYGQVMFSCNCHLQGWYEQIFPVWIHIFRPSILTWIELSSTWVVYWPDSLVV